MKVSRLESSLASVAIALALSGCQGLFDGVYDEPADEDEVHTSSGKLYIDASDWTQWHYIDLVALHDSLEADSGYNTSSAWITMPVPMPDGTSATDEEYPMDNAPGIYTYWYDVFGQGISNYTFSGYRPSAIQPEPQSWTIAVHRNNVRTNGCGVCATEYDDIDRLPISDQCLTSLTYTYDQWCDNGVWVNQDRMLSGYVGNQGIDINYELSTWLTLEIPPMPPAFKRQARVYVIKLPDGTYGALQLHDYISESGVKCCLTINYKYPL